MPDPIRLNEDAWKDAEAFIQRVERATRSDVSSQRFYDDLTVGFGTAAKASATAVWVVDSGDQVVLSRWGIDLSQNDDTDLAKLCQQAGTTPTAHWLEPMEESGATRLPGGERLVATLRIHDETVFGLTLRFNQPIDWKLRQPLQELSEVILDLASSFYVREQYRAVRRQLGRQADRDAFVGALNEGVGVTESFASIALTVAQEIKVDRVGLLRLDRSRVELVASSTQPRIDRRARQVRLLEHLTDAVAQAGGVTSFVVGDPVEVDHGVRDILEQYLKESGCREIHIETISDDGETPIAAIVIERFRLQPEQDQSAAGRLDPIRVPLRDAISRALTRDDVGWSLVAARLSSGSIRRRALTAAAAFVLLASLLWMVPATLSIPVEGRILASETSRLFAPSEGTVVDVCVDNGDMIHEGDRIVVLRSPKLELHQKDLEGDLDTARTRLASLGALRSAGSSPSMRESARGGSTDELVLKTQIAGLEQQLVLVRQQIDALTIVSPIDGQVDRWNLTESLLSRPVSHGQYLADVVSTGEGWRIELELPDRYANYVLSQQSQQPCRCTFSLTSGSDHVYEATVKEIADVAHLNPQGQSMIHVVVPFDSQDADEFRVGSTVLAEIHCGKRSLGFVWLRGLFEWSRRQTWF